jgi:hypothetical protein
MSFLTRRPMAAGAVGGAKRVKKLSKSSTAAAMPRFVEPQLCKLVARATAEQRWNRALAHVQELETRIAQHTAGVGPE